MLASIQVCQCLPTIFPLKLLTGTGYELSKQENIQL